MMTSGVHEEILQNFFNDVRLVNVKLTDNLIYLASRIDLPFFSHQFVQKCLRPRQPTESIDVRPTTHWKEKWPGPMVQCRTLTAVTTTGAKPFFIN